MSEDFTSHEYDVIVIGAGGAGLRAAIESARSGAKTAIITKSLLGKAHTVMAEGGCAATPSSGDSSFINPLTSSKCVMYLSDKPSQRNFPWTSKY